MKTLLRKWLGLDDESQAQHTSPNINQAAAALMIEIMAADDEWKEAEADRIKQLMSSTLQLPAHEIDTAFESARDTQQESHDLFHLTSVINQHYGRDQKYDLLKALWEVAYADGRLDHYEEHMIRKLSELLHLTHTQFIQAKLAAQPDT